MATPSLSNQVENENDSTEEFSDDFYTSGDATTQSKYTSTFTLRC
jgi:hypothetical protein